MIFRTRLFTAVVAWTLLSSPDVCESQDLSGQWVVQIEVMDAVDFQRWTVQQSADGILTGTVADRILGTLVLAGEITPECEINIELRRDAAGGNARRWQGRVVGEQLIGEGIWRGGINWQWKAERATARPVKPSTHVFAPQTFSATFSANLQPVLRVFPGDTVRTFTIDVHGEDADRVSRSFHGMLTGPFYIEGALPGDALAVRLTRVRANREMGFTHGLFHPSAITPEYYERLNKDHPIVEWSIDAQRGVVTVKEPSDQLKNLEIPLRPMLGMIGVAPPGDRAVDPNTLGPWGGNLDYNRIEEGVIVYLPVLQPGALLYLGDGHAAQGAGEISGAGIETSLDFEFVVDLIPSVALSTPRIETPNELISVGIGGELERAMQRAVTDLAQWLGSEYGLSSSDAALLLGQAVQLDIAQVVGRDRTVGARINKTLLSK